MKTFQHLLVGMDLSPTDRKLLRYLDLLLPTIGENICFTHVRQTLELPETTGEEGHIHPRDERFIDEMKDVVNTTLSKVPKEAGYKIVEGKVTKELLQLEKSMHIDLTLLGLKRPQAGSGVSARSFIRKSKGSVLFIPDVGEPSIRNILVAADFSEHSVVALQKAIDLARSLSPRPQVHVLRVFDVPDDIHFEMDRTQEQFEVLIRENVETAYRHFIRKVSTSPIKVHPHLVENRSYNPARHIIRHADAIGADLLVIGSQGHSFLSSYLLGSVTEKVLSYNKERACLIVRKST